MSFIYYSGHGAANLATKTNYLIPIDVPNADDESLWSNSLDLQTDIIDKLKTYAPSVTHFVVFDACRNELKLKSKTKAFEIDGKAFVPVRQVSGMLIAYATQAGHTASDNGVYAKVLAANLVVLGVEAVSMFRNVQLTVRRLTNQSPFQTEVRLPEFYFAGPPVAAEVTPQPTPAVTYKACRHPDFGQEGWNRAEDFVSSSGWVSGGRDQKWWCNQAANSFISARSIGPRHHVEYVGSSEDSRKDILGHVTYNYRCTVRIKWDPLYAERIDPRCGIAGN